MAAHTRQAYYSDYVTDAAGHAMAGATVALYPVGLFAPGALPTDQPTLVPTATTTTDASGRFVFTDLFPDDYHVFVQYTPAGGTPQLVWHYYVAVAPYEESRRSAIHGMGSAIPRTLAKILSGLPVTVLCIGDDVTVGYAATGTVSGGWVARLATNFASALPSAQVVRYDPANYATTLDAPIPSWIAASVQSAPNGSSSQQITIVNAGVTGDTVPRVLRRFSNVTAASWYPAPDCYVVQLGSGEMSADPTRAASPAEFAAQLIGLVNNLRINGADVVLCTPHVGQSAVDDYAAQVRGVAASTGCGLVDVRQLWQDHFDPNASNDGYGTWLNTIAGDHTSPTDAGHAAMGDEVFRIFDAERALPVRGPLASASDWERVRLLNTSAQLQFTGSWTEQSGFTLSSLLASPREMLTHSPGDRLTVTLRGSDIYMLCRRWHDGGRVTVTVDGAQLGTVDLYCASPASTTDMADDNGAMVPQERIPLALGLSDAVHTITLELASVANPAAQGTVWRFDALDVLRLRQGGVAIEGGEPLQRIQRGTIALALNGVSSATAAVTFPLPYSGMLPVVFAQSPHPSYCTTVSQVSATGATITLVQSAGAAVTDTQVVSWMAFG